MRNKIISLFNVINEKWVEQFGFHMKDVSLERLSDYLFSPRDSSSLAVTRILFGLAMLVDIPDERGGATMEARWGDPSTCHFPLLSLVQAVPMPYMALIYAALWLGALGITLGYKYRYSATMFTICYWYLFLIEKSYWNNHSYLFGLVALLLTFTEAHCFWSLDVYLDPSLKSETVPYWNYFILKYQFFILYFMAGLKKGTAEWLTGYSVMKLSEHWVFYPFQLFLTVPQIDYMVVHWFVFAFDLTVAIWMMWSKTRHIAMLFSTLFHLMNSRLFNIGMFPWVCLATMPLFYPFDWPKNIMYYAKQHASTFKTRTCECIDKVKSLYSHKCNIITNKEDDEVNSDKANKENAVEKSPTVDEDMKTKAGNSVKDKASEIANCIDNANDSDDKIENQKHKKNLTCLFILFHIISQLFLPYSHFITKGYNNWTQGLYGYSWDMMVHTWDIYSVVIKVVDNRNGTEYFIEPDMYAPNDRWTRHGDMLPQYAHCIKGNLKRLSHNSQEYEVISDDISIYIDVLCSLNGRFTQRVFDPKVDLLNVPWSPFQPVSYLMPLLDEALHWRSFLYETREKVRSWNNYSDVIFIADFPGYNQEKYIPTELTNVTLSIVEGKVAYEPELLATKSQQSVELTTGDDIQLNSGLFHKVINIDKKPVFYMYTYTNATDLSDAIASSKPMLPIGKELFRRFINMITFAKIVFLNIAQIVLQMC